MRRRPFLRAFLGIAAMACALLACGLQFGPPTMTPTVPAPTLPAPTQTLPAAAPRETATATVAVTDTPAPTPTSESTATSSGPLTGRVLQKANCRYGPGAYYLYKIGMRADAPIEVVGRTIDGDWAQIQFQGTRNLCWINSSLIELSGDIMSLPDTYRDSSSLPFVGKYGPAEISSVSGAGGSVTVEWTSVDLPEVAMVSEIEAQYVVEVWTCENGSPGFYSLGTNETDITFEVDSSCGQLSHADLVAQNKLGVSGVTEIPLP